MAGTEFIIIFILWGFVLGKILPLSVDGWRKWWYNRKGIPYFLIYVLLAGKIVYKSMIKQDQTTFNYDKGKYVTSLKDENNRPYSPAIELSGQKILFYNKNNTNPLVFKDIAVPGHNDPEIFRAIIEDNSIRQALSPEYDMSELKRFILVTMGILGITIAGIMYLLMGV